MEEEMTKKKKKKPQVSQTKKKSHWSSYLHTCLGFPVGTSICPTIPNLKGAHSWIRTLRNDEPRGQSKALTNMYSDKSVSPCLSSTSEGEKRTQWHLGTGAILKVSHGYSCYGNHFLLWGFQRCLSLASIIVLKKENKGRTQTEIASFYLKFQKVPNWACWRRGAGASGQREHHEAIWASLRGIRSTRRGLERDLLSRPSWGQTDLFKAQIKSGHSPVQHHSMAPHWFFSDKTLHIHDSLNQVFLCHLFSPTSCLVSYVAISQVRTTADGWSCLRLQDLCTFYGLRQRHSGPHTPFAWSAFSPQIP